MDSHINRKAIVQLKEKLVNKETIPKTEEATKQWLVVPFIAALGYDPYSSDIVPEYTLDFGIKKGEKVDYMVQVNNQPVMIVECKQLNVSLGEKHISQLFRYFSVSNVHIALLTNGDDYWFFTDSQKDNLMDNEPYLKIRLSEADNKEIGKLDMYCKELIQYNDMSKLVRFERFQTDVKELIEGLRYNRIPTWLIEQLMERSGGLSEFTNSVLAQYINDEVIKVFNGYKVTTSNKVKSNELKAKNNKASQGETRDKNKQQRSNIKLNYEYVFNDYSDGDWTFHKIDYAILFGEKLQDISARQLLIKALESLIDKGYIEVDEIVENDFIDYKRYIVKRGTGEGVEGAYYIEKYDIYITTKFGMNDIVKFIEALLNYAKVSYDSVKISFKE